MPDICIKYAAKSQQVCKCFLALCNNILLCRSPFNLSSPCADGGVDGLLGSAGIQCSGCSCGACAVMADQDSQGHRLVPAPAAAGVCHACAWRHRKHGVHTCFSCKLLGAWSALDVNGRSLHVSSSLFCDPITGLLLCILCTE